jgi:hypothetical protein
MIKFLSDLFTNKKENKIDYTSKEISILIEQLDKLINLDNDEGIVISLQGSWGIGKTFFWNHYIERKEQGDKFVNISLFGINTLDEIKNKILIEISDISKVTNKLKELVGSGVLGVDVGAIISSIDKKEFKNIVLCFDDFERISPNLSLSEILGFISELKEQHNCKIVLINNNDMLKIQDELNHKKYIEKDKDNNFIEKSFTTQTNNQEIFDKYSEKIIDITLKYEPHLKDNIKFIKIKNEDKDYINWELLEKLFDLLDENGNKRLNIRLMKQVILKLELLEDILKDEKINEKIKNGITLEIFKRIINEKLDLTYLDIELRIPYKIKNDNTFKNIVEKHSLNKDFFKDEIYKFNKSINLQETNTKIHQNIDKIYFRYLYDLEYDNKQFVQDFYDALNIKDTDIVQLIGLSNFEFYITSFLKELDNKEIEKYNSMFIEKSKLYIKNNINSLQNLDMFTKKGVDRVLDNYEELQKYYDEIKISSTQDTTNDIENIKIKLTELLSNKGWNNGIEDLLGTISFEQHHQWMIEDREYFEIVFNFISWINGFAGDKPFNIMYTNIINVYKELSKEEKYKHKMKFIIDRFKISI